MSVSLHHLLPVAMRPPARALMEFISSGYSGLRKTNPDVKFMIREGNSVSPSIYARYEFGKEVAVRVDNASKDEILEKIKKLCL
ncbi:unnamed protein product [Schistocephalus solidus]|uniref:NADH dehydrogenase [ubiquinone] 1 alpha subcomplex subunit 2 n=1 Tax=Schistocephalus solidus TaxID=70667 RepID=A0A3P7EPC8_SCHSO|nr:unnamed protein product [Schistocephalus solidus]